jgi:hypothetical protein
MAHEEVLSILDQALLDFDATKRDESIKNLLQAVFTAIEWHIDADDVPGLRSRLPRIVSLYSTQPDWYLLESLIARAIDSASTACIDGVPHGDSTSSALEPLVLASCSRWSRRLTVNSESLDVSIFLKLPEWTPQSVSIIKNLIYASENARNVSRAFLESKASLDRPASHLAPVIWSWLDAEGSNDIGSSRTWRKHLSKLAAGIISTSAPRHHRITYGRAIRAMVEKLPSLRSDLSLDLLACIKGMPKDTLTAEVLKLGRRLVGILPQEDNGFASTLLEHALSWMAGPSQGSDVLDSDVVRALGAILLTQLPTCVNLSSEFCEVFPKYQASPHRCCSYGVDSESSV